MERDITIAAVLSKARKDFKYVDEEDESSNINQVQYIPHTNVVTKDKLRRVQNIVLEHLSNFVSATYGPMGSNTMIVKGETSQSISAAYSKDGLKVLKNIAFDKALELSIQSEMVDIARYVEHEVGDGTTSSVILTASIFKQLSMIEKNGNIAPRRLIKLFQDVVGKISDEILSQGRECTIDDIYHICMISTNGNKEISENIANIYKDYGMDVSIDVGISNDANHKIKIYDGMTIEEGYSDPAYINDVAHGTSIVHNPRIYAFADPIDTGEMVSFLEKIIINNIFMPLQNGEESIPTVICTPKISRDASSILGKLVELLYGYSNQKMDSQKPEIMILTNLSGTDEDIYFDIAKLCRCRMIRKYIDPNIQAKDQENGDAPTLDNIVEWYGTAEIIEADADKTKFIRPICMADPEDTTYNAIITFLNSEIKKCVDENADKLEIARLKKRLRALEANMIDYMIGGISVSDRDAIRDLVEDAVKNCKSAAENGVGYAANFEGLRASWKTLVDLIAKNPKSGTDNYYKMDIAEVIFSAYAEAAEILYSTVLDRDNIDNIVEYSINEDKPFDVASINNTGSLDGAASDTVLTSIKTDVVILEAISRMVTNMVTANQCLLQNPAVNKY